MTDPGIPDVAPSAVADSSVVDATDAREIAEVAAPNKLVCSEFHFYECESRCFKVEPLPGGGPGCFGSGGCGDTEFRVVFHEDGTISNYDVPTDGLVGTYRAASDGQLADVTRLGLTTKCVRTM